MQNCHKILSKNIISIFLDLRVTKKNAHAYRNAKIELDVMVKITQTDQQNVSKNVETNVLQTEKMPLKIVSKKRRKKMRFLE